MNKEPVRPTTHLFILLIWSEHLDNGQVEWRGRVQLASTGERHYFRGWRSLIEHIRTMLSEEELPPSKRFS